MQVKTVTHYVLGFLFNEKVHDLVLLIRRSPDARILPGVLNGIGGKVDPGEQPLDAMSREFREEAGQEFSDWNWLYTFRGDGWMVHTYFGVGDFDLNKQYSVTDGGKIEAHFLPTLPKEVDRMARASILIASQIVDGRILGMWNG